MKTKGIIALGLIGAISIGGGVAYAQVSKNTVPKNVVMTETSVAQVSNKEAESYKKIALDAFEKYFNEDVNSKGLYERLNKLYEQGGQKSYIISWCDQKGETINGNTAIQYTAVIDTKTNKILQLEYHPGVPKNKDYQEFSYDTAKDLADKFVKENNLFNGVNYEFLDKQSKEVNSSNDKASWDYYFYYKYNGKTCLVTVNKDLKKVSQFLFVDEISSLG
ncbi:hypothetical protein [Bacillus sp. FJAT-52991]|uniref:Uncharacterized protein n=1 Tax=Bacillus kandeliae TaxID=3129297 RepID=A0ABZ2N2C2_9BACI